MSIRNVDCVIERRLLVNFRVRPDQVARHLPAGLRPQLVGEVGVAGICLIRLGQLRPRGIPGTLGMTTENVAHRFAVEWDEDGVTRSGVYVPRRDSSSGVSALAGGRLFPGSHLRATIRVRETERELAISVRNHKQPMSIKVSASDAASLGSSLFATTDEAIQFFRRGSQGYSPSLSGSCLEGVQLQCERWEATPVVINEIYSSFFEDPKSFEPGSVVVDCGLIMRNLPARWRATGDLSSGKELISLR
ncbi:MAG: DUF2071 domain-containing protein [Acidimicrobiales bacterium]